MSRAARSARAESPPLDPQAWFQARGLAPFPFQREVWEAIARGESGLLHANTGAGKTFAVWWGALAAFHHRVSQRPGRPPGLTILWITPMRALAADTVRALSEPLAELGSAWTVGLRTGDTPSSERARQERVPPTVLVTTPESLSLMLTRADARERFSGLSLVVVDEWHELIGNKRGVQVQLALARLRRWRPELAVWGLSATLAELPTAAETLLGHAGGCIVRGQVDKPIVIDTLLPPPEARVPWGGHLGLSMLTPVVDELESARTALVFLNTRSQAEIWYQALLEARPDWAGLIALHHGSLDREVREWVELGLKEGRLKAVVCTSSLDLGVDFLPVERVLQIGSAKGVARLLQRAGRSGHAPGRTARATLVPTQALELIEAAAAQDAIAAHRIEARRAPSKPLDVLVQHLVTVALGGGFAADDLFEEVRSAWSFRELSQEEWRWALDFVERGGQSLTAYPEYRRVARDPDGLYHVPDATIAKRHRLGVGTIVSDASIVVRFMGGAKLGTVEESFIARMKRGDHFLFAGRLLELVRVHEMTAYVRRATGRKPAVPRWNGGKMPLSSELADAVLARLGEARRGTFRGPEMEAARALLELQLKWSDVPTRDQLLVEALDSREGHHLFVYPFAGRQVHIGLAALWAWRIGQERSASFSVSLNDYGFELLSPDPVDWSALRSGRLLATENLFDETLQSLNAAELAQRRFREIARVSGLVFQGYPGQPKSLRQLQASSSLFFEVFKKYDAGNMLLVQAEREVLEQELEMERLAGVLTDLAQRSVVWRDIERPTPFAFPLMVERLRETMSTEKLDERIARLVRDMETAARVDTAATKRVRRGR